MFFTLDLQSDVAIYLQVVRQVKFAVAAGTLRPGQLLPSVRALSGQLAINPNTVARAFTTLQSEGVIESLRGRGMVVCPSAVDICLDERVAVLRGSIGTALTEAWNSGLSRERIQGIVDEHLQRLADTPPNVHASPSGNGSAVGTAKADTSESDLTSDSHS
ncbi:GntR family transcriptional regulator [Stieleria varia]|uniref:HTH-type transcriptional repressor YtrA n=1 Tax=Stieleria varia TaxID=2528005 RepID=A0A5C5ZKQ7_9BACT|nr:GntR family transcriptional regulator [Stieleria varia]TWT87992.1 HTH-type transcriptional repressor YtrA [Stieleria varia]